MMNTHGPGRGNKSNRIDKPNDRKAGDEISSGQSVEVSFALLTLPRIWVRGNVTWRKPGSKSFGVRFDVQDERRLRIKEWIDAYLEN